MALNQIKSPHDIKSLSIESLELLAKEIRSKIINVMSHSGGHLSSNLGAVELTLALHYVFDFEEDKLVFDVGHQCYTHKLITGRNDDLFSKLRQTDGYSGFINPEESDYDLFYSGHAGNALSLSLGLAHSRTLKKEKKTIVSVLGDASLTCGLTLEALNNINTDLEKFIIILNDNKMSISKNVGRVSLILSRLINSTTINILNYKIDSLIKKIPIIGPWISRQCHKISKSIKSLISKAPFFEQFGLSYIGPEDGHDIGKLISILENVKHTKEPVIIHLLTKKGLGLEKAELDSVAYHGSKPFDKESCEFKSSNDQRKTFPEIFGECITEIGKINQDLCVTTPAMSVGSCIEQFKSNYPDRFFDVGIAEGHALTFSAGLAKNKTKVICSIYSTFLQRALDNVYHDICIQNLPVIIAVDRSGLAFNDGFSHHGIYDLGFLQMMPNLVICQPRNGALLKDLLFSSLNWNSPVAIRYPNIKTTNSNFQIKQRSIGKGELIKEGEDILIISLGHMYATAISVSNNLIKHNISAAIFDPIFVKPLDVNALRYFSEKYKTFVIIEEHSDQGGLYSAISMFLNSLEEKITIISFAIKDIPKHGNVKDILKHVSLDEESITVSILNLYNQKIVQTI